MQSESSRKIVLPNASHLDCILSVACASIAVGPPDEPHGIVLLLEQQHSDDFLVTVDDEIPSVLGLILILLNQFLGSETIQMAILASHHDR